MLREHETEFRPLEVAALRVSTSFFRAALSIYARSPHVEDGGRIVGFVERAVRSTCAEIIAGARIEGMIPSGPLAQRTPTSLQQDGEWQEEIFRRVEHAFPDLEHIGSFHHHCSFGRMPFLSERDVEGYRHTLSDPRYRHSFYLAVLLHTPVMGLAKPEESWADFFNVFLVTKEHVHLLDPRTTRLECHDEDAVAAAIDTASARPVGAHRRPAGRAALAAIVRRMTELGTIYSAALVGDFVEIRLHRGPRIRMVSPDQFDIFSGDDRVRVGAALPLEKTLEYLTREGVS